MPHSYTSGLLCLQLAPSLPLQEDFVYHWKAITHYYIETSGKSMRAYDLLQDEFSVTLLLTLNSFTFDSSLRDILNVPLERLLCCRCSGQRELSSCLAHAAAPAALS